jgi:hypothetical protein
MLISLLSLVMSVLPRHGCSTGGASHCATALRRKKQRPPNLLREGTNTGRVIAHIDIFGRMTPVEFEPGPLTPAA